jgi:hypothetical protein
MPECAPAAFEIGTGAKAQFIFKQNRFPIGG